MGSERNIATVQAIYEAFGRGDVAAILEHLAEDVAWDQDTPSWGLPWYEPRSGRDAVPGFFAALGQGLQLTRFEPTAFLADERQVAVPIAITAVVGGREIADLEVHLFTFDDSGRVSRFAHVLDRHAQVCAWRGIEP